MSPDFTYDRDWLKTQTGTHEWGRRALLGAMAHLGIPSSLLDVGCGDGYVVDFASALGIDAVGVDIAPDERDRILQVDLRKGFDLYRRFDMVLSWEVGEHLPAESSDQLVDSIVLHADRFIVFTAARVGQGGDGHLNCQPQEYWREKFEERGADYLRNATAHLVETWAWSTGPADWYPRNLQVFMVADAQNGPWYNP